MPVVTFSLAKGHFNSIKVRLERKFDINKKENLQFQFHKGAIRTFDTLPFPLV